MAEKRCYGCMKPKTQSPVCEHCGFNENAVNEPHQLPFGTVLRGQYEVGKVLGQGGFGITYLGLDRYLDVPVAIKEFYPNGVVTRDCSRTLGVTTGNSGLTQTFHSSRERFLREVRTLARFGDVPQIVRVQNFFEENGTAYIIMEYVRGVDLRRYINMRGGRLTAEETFTILRPVMEALSEVHKAGLVHRDISPDNIMMLPRGGAKLLDFGAARDVENPDAEQMLSRSTESILKHGFAPIEQYQRRGSLGPWTDVYALCGTIYYCLTGKVPADAPARVLEDVQLDFRSIPGLTEAQAAALEKGMEIRAKDRFPSVAALCEAMFGGQPEPLGQKLTDYPSQTAALEREKAACTAPGAEQYPSYTLPLETQTPSSQYTAPVSRQGAPYAAPPQDSSPQPSGKKPADKKLLLGIGAAVLALIVGVGALSGKTEEDKPTLSVMETEAGIPVIAADAEGTTDAAESAATLQGNVLMADPGEAGSYKEGIALPVFGSDIAREEILTVTFLDTLENAPSSNWDVSAAQDGSVLAWAVKNGEYYDLYIAGEGGVTAPEDMSRMFAYYDNTTHISFGGNLHTQNTTTMSYLFYICDVDEIDFTGVDTGNVTDMSCMFYGSGVVSLDLRNFDTRNVTNMHSMFQSCMSLLSIDVSSFDTANVTNMSGMFASCFRLPELDVSNLNTSAVEDMNWMFYNCETLKELDLRNFDTAKVTDMHDMFHDCENLSVLDLTSFQTRGVTNMDSMFENCTSLTTLRLGSGFDTSNVEKYGDFMDSGEKVNGKPWKELFN